MESIVALMVATALGGDLNAVNKDVVFGFSTLLSRFESKTLVREVGVLLKMEGSSCSTPIPFFLCFVSTLPPPL